MDITQRQGSLHKYLDLSSYDRVFVCGDVHAEYALLQSELDRVNFNTERDMVVLVGDLADRGSDSQAALEWIKKPFVARALGNHDIAPGLFLDGQITKQSINEQFGGAWYTSLPDDQIRVIADAFEDAPVALTITLPSGKRIGVAHADCMRDWDRQIAYLEEWSRDRIWVADLILWSRETIKPLIITKNSGIHFSYEVIEEIRVSGIDHVFHGHTILDEPLTLANRSWIDTGAYCSGNLTLVNIDEFLNQQEKVDHD